jgi:hypothetical protein
MMPDVDGFELIKQMRESETFKDLVIIVSSASVFEADQYRSIEAGGNDFPAQTGTGSGVTPKIAKASAPGMDLRSAAAFNQARPRQCRINCPTSSRIRNALRISMKGNFKGIMKQVALLKQRTNNTSPLLKKCINWQKAFKTRKF